MPPKTPRPSDASARTPRHSNATPRTPSYSDAVTRTPRHSDAVSKTPKHSDRPTSSSSSRKSEEPDVKNLTKDQAIEKYLFWRKEYQKRAEQHTEAYNAYKKIKAELIEEEKKSENLESEVERMKNKISELEKDLETSKNSTTNEKGSNESSLKTSKAHTAEIEKLKERIAFLQKERENMSFQITVKTKEIVMVKREMENFKKQRLDHSTDLSAFQSELEEIKKALQAAKNENETLKQKYQEVLTSKSVDEEKENSKYAKLKQKYANLKAENDSQIEELKNQVEKERKKNKELKSEVDMWMADNQKRGKEVVELLKKLEAKEEETKKSTEWASDKEKELREIKKINKEEVGELLSQIGLLKHQLSSREKSLTSARESNNKLLDDFCTLQHTLRKLVNKTQLVFRHSTAHHVERARSTILEEDQREIRSLIVDSRDILGLDAIDTPDIDHAETYSVDSGAGNQEDVVEMDNTPEVDEDQASQVPQNPESTLDYGPKKRSRAEEDSKVDIIGTKRSKRSTQASSSAGIVKLEPDENDIEIISETLNPAPQPAASRPLSTLQAQVMPSQTPQTWSRPAPTPQILTTISQEHDYRMPSHLQTTMTSMPPVSTPQIAYMVPHGNLMAMPSGSWAVPAGEVVPMQNLGQRMAIMGQNTISSLPPTDPISQNTTSKPQLVRMKIVNRQNLVNNTMARGHQSPSTTRPTAQAHAIPIRPVHLSTILTPRAQGQTQVMNRQVMHDQGFTQLPNGLFARLESLQSSSNARQAENASSMHVTRNTWSRQEVDSFQHQMSQLKQFTNR